MTIDQSKELLKGLHAENQLIQSIQTAMAESTGLALPNGRYVTGKEELETELIRQLDSLIKAKGRIIAAIMKISDIRFRTILLEHYINGKDWVQIAAQFEVARQTVCKKWLGPALEEFIKNY
jgi:hypothetical protein